MHLRGCVPDVENVMVLHTRNDIEESIPNHMILTGMGTTWRHEFGWIPEIGRRKWYFGILAPSRLLTSTNHDEVSRNIGHTLRIHNLSRCSIRNWFLPTRPPSHISVFSERAQKCNPTTHQARFDIFGEHPNPKEISSHRLKSH